LPTLQSIAQDGKTHRQVLCANPATETQGYNKSLSIRRFQKKRESMLAFNIIAVLSRKFAWSCHCISQRNAVCIVDAGDGK